MLDGINIRQNQDGSHSYFTSKGLWLPGATRILADLGYYNGSDFFTDVSRDRGKAVHKAVFLIDEHAPQARTLDEVLDVLRIGEALWPYVEGYLWFKRDKGFVANHNEFSVWSKKLKSAGQIDKWGRYSGGERVLLDMKTWANQGAKPKHSAELQTAGYKLQAKECMGLETDLRVVLKLPGDGKYREYVCDNPRDEITFSHCCSVWWDQAEHGLRKCEGVSDVEQIAA